MKEGAILLDYIDRQKRPKSKIAEELGMSRRNLYQIFDSQTLEHETKERFETYFGEKIFGEIAINRQKDKAAAIANLINKNQVNTADYKDEYIQSLKDQIALYKEKCEKLEKDSVSLSEMNSNQEALIVMVKEALKRAANYRYASTDKKKLAEELDEINRIIGGVLK